MTNLRMDLQFFNRRQLVELLAAINEANPDGKWTSKQSDFVSERRVCGVTHDFYLDDEPVFQVVEREGMVTFIDLRIHRYLRSDIPNVLALI